VISKKAYNIISHKNSAKQKIKTNNLRTKMLHICISNCDWQKITTDNTAHSGIEIAASSWYNSGSQVQNWRQKRWSPTGTDYSY